jgi:hypothetical protein
MFNPFLDCEILFCLYSLGRRFFLKRFVFLCNPKDTLFMQILCVCVCFCQGDLYFSSLIIVYFYRSCESKFCVRVAVLNDPHFDGLDKKTVHYGFTLSCYCFRQMPFLS